MANEKHTLAELTQAHEFEIVSLDGDRKYMNLSKYRIAS